MLHTPNRCSNPPSALRFRHAPGLHGRSWARAARLPSRTALLRHDSSLKIENTTCSTAIMIECALQTRSWNTNDIAATSRVTLDAARPASRSQPCQPPKRSLRGREGARRQRCARRLLRLISHCKHAVESLTTLPQRPGQHSTPRDQPAARDCQPPSGRCADARRTSRRRCVRRAASLQRGSNSVSPLGLRRARIPPEPPISKSGLIDPEFEYPGVVFRIERAKCQVGAPSQSSMTKGSFRHDFEFSTR